MSSFILTPEEKIKEEERKTNEIYAKLSFIENAFIELAGKVAELTEKVDAILGEEEGEE